MQMVNWIHTLTNIELGILLMSIGITVSTVIPIFIRYHFKLDYKSDALAKSAEESFKLVTTMTLLLLAFCLVRAQENHRNVEDLVAREATIVYKLNRDLGSYGSEEATVLQAKARSYAQSMIDDEWPLLSTGGRSVKTSALLDGLDDGSRQLIPATQRQQIAQSEILNILAQMSDVREARLSASHLSLPLYYWQAICCSIMVLIVVGWFQHPMFKLVIYVGGVVLGVCLMLALLIATDGVFIGQNRVTPLAIERIVPLIGLAEKHSFPVQSQMSPTL
jgi:hypothetical protein